MMMRVVYYHKGQSLIEYALVIAIVGMAASAMSVYVYRAVQAQQKTVSDEYQKD
jgi:type II secretory pathway pseudopilin PulG